MKKIDDQLKETYIETAFELKAAHRRRFMAQIVNSLGYGGAFWAEREMGWDRKVIMKGQRELREGSTLPLRKPGSGRLKAEIKLPQLLHDIRKIVDEESQTDPTFKSTKLYARITALVVRETLMNKYHYTDEELPCRETIGLKLNQLGYKLRAVQKSQPKKKSPKQMPSSNT